jgi:uncharacterized protein YkwD
VIAVLGLGVLAGSSSALGAHSRTHKRVHRAVRCSRAVHARNTRGRSTRRSKRSGRVACKKHRSRAVKHAVRKPAGSHRHARSRSADSGAGSCADAGLAPNAQNLERIRVATLCLVNRERTSHGENPLTANSDLQQAAQGHTTSMVVENYFEHLGPGGETPLQRMRASGYIYNSQIGYAVGENIAWGTLSMGTPRSIVAAWMASPGHRANILEGRFKDTGIGVSPHPPTALGGGQSGGIYTQDFGVLVGG